MLKKTVIILLMLTLAPYVFSQEDFTMDFDSVIGLGAYQYDFPDQFRDNVFCSVSANDASMNVISDNNIYPDYCRENQTSIDISLDTILYARHNINADISMYYSLSWLIGYARNKDLYGNISELIIELAFWENQETELNLKIGRQPFIDPTANMINQSLDGILAHVQSGIIQANFGIGYSGLFPSILSNLILTPDDKSTFRNTEWGSAPQRFVIAGDITFDIIPTIQLGTHIGIQADLRENPENYGLSSWYIGVHNSGIVVPEILNYTAQMDISVSHFTNQADPQAGFFINNHWTFIFPTESRGQMSAGFDLATQGFRTISNIKQGYYFLSDLASLFTVSWRFDWQPFSTGEEYWIKNLNIFLQGKHFISTEQSPEHRGGIPSVSSSSPVYGQEFTLGFDFRPLSDVGIEAFMGGLLGDVTGNGQFFSSIFVYFTF